ncbi:hypothetical protein A2U01_0052152, partial [Trifolium medium]|nr:hypothetical protein [Trifolium medium]
MQASRLAHKEKLQKSRQETFVVENQEKDEEEETESEKGNNLSSKPKSLEFVNENNGFIHLPTPSPPHLKSPRYTTFSPPSNPPPSTKPPPPRPSPKPPPLLLPPKPPAVSFKATPALALTMPPPPPKPPDVK